MAKNTRGRRPDLRRIMNRRSYTVAQAADLLGIRQGAVRNWLGAGLPCLDDARPVLIMGFAMKAWLKERRNKARKSCKVDELYCFRCREPRWAAQGSIAIITENEKTVRITGRCVECDTRMNRKGSRAKLDEIKRTFRISTKRHATLGVSDDPLVNRDLEMEKV